MNITKFFALMGVGAIMCSLVACNDDVQNVSTKSITVSNYIIPDDTNAPITVQHGCMYNFVFDNVSGKMTIATTSLDLPNAAGLTMTTNEFKFERYTYDLYETVIFRNGSGKLSNGEEVTIPYGFVTNIVNYQTPINDSFGNYTPNPMLVCSFKVGNYLIRTFSPNAYYTGTTNTFFQAQGETVTYQTKDCVYRVNFAQDMKTANVVLYNVKFSEQMKSIQAVILKSLPVALTRDGFEIEGTDIVPEMMEAGAATPFPSKTFDTIKIKSSADLREISCEYMVSGMFHGSFKGISCDYISPL